MTSLQNCNKLLTGIELYNVHPDRFCFTKSYTLVDKEKCLETRAEDVDVFNTFFGYLNNALDEKATFSLDKWKKMKVVLLTFVAKSTEIEDTTKKALELAVQFGIQKQIDSIDPLSKVKQLTVLEEVHQILSIEDVRFLESALQQLALERVSIFYLLLFSSTELLKYSLLAEFEKIGGAIKPVTATEFSIDWENIKSLSAEEFALSHHLEQKSKKSLRPALLSVIKAFDKSDLPQIIKVWRSFLSIVETERILIFFRALLNNTPGPFSAYAKGTCNQFFSAETKEIFDLSQKKTLEISADLKQDAMWQKNKKSVFSCLEKLMTRSKEFSSQFNEQNAFYKRVYDAFCQAKTRHKGFRCREVSSLLGVKLLTPSQFESFAFSGIAVDTFDTTFQNSYTPFQEGLLQKDEAYTFEHLFELLELKELFSVKEITKRFYKAIGVHKAFPAEKNEPIESLVSSIENLAIEQKKHDPEAHRSRKNRSRRKHVKLKSPQPSVKQPKEKTFSIQIIDAPLHLAPRVQDWKKKEPKAWSSTPYATLTQEKKEEARFFHSYPFIITQILMKTPPKKWQVKETLYSKSGSITCYGENKAPVEGYFADCFNEKLELYHHFFHKKLFLQQLRQENEPTFDNDDPLQKEAPILAEKQHQERFVIRKKSFVIEVDDIEKKVLYTICFPEGCRKL